MSVRYAVYFVPEPGTALAAAGSRLLGRDSETGQPVPQPCLPDFPASRLHELTTEARRYGLHATLKAPFFLKPGMTERALLLSAARFVQGRQPIILPRLELARIGSFFALVPAGASPEEREAIQRINALAADAVTFFDAFRAAPSEREIARRNPQRLSARQRALLAEWGYPYVFDEYRFHITLTNALPEDRTRDNLAPRLSAYLAPACHQAVAVASLAICKQVPRDPAARREARVDDSGNASFRLLQRIYFWDRQSGPVA